MTTMTAKELNRRVKKLERRLTVKPGEKRYPDQRDIDSLTPDRSNSHDRTADNRPWYFWPALFGAILVDCFAYGFFQGDLVKLMVGAL